MHSSSGCFRIDFARNARKSEFYSLRKAIVIHETVKNDNNVPSHPIRQLWNLSVIICYMITIPSKTVKSNLPLKIVRRYRDGTTVLRWKSLVQHSKAYFARFYPVQLYDDVRSSWWFHDKHSCDVHAEASAVKRVTYASRGKKNGDLFSCAEDVMNNVSKILLIRNGKR